MSVIGYVAVSFTSYYVEIFATLSTALTGKIITGISNGKRSNRGWLYKERAEEAEMLFSAKKVEQCRREDLKLLETRFLFRANCVGIFIYIFATTDILYHMYNVNDRAGYSHMILSSTILL